MSLRYPGEGQKVEGPGLMASKRVDVGYVLWVPVCRSVCYIVRGAVYCDRSCLCLWLGVFVGGWVDLLPR